MIASLADEALVSTRKLIVSFGHWRRRGIARGISSGAAWRPCFQLAARLKAVNEGARIVTIFPDSGAKYLSERFWEDGN